MYEKGVLIVLAAVAITALVACNALIFMVFMGIGTDLFSDIGVDSSMDISVDVLAGGENVGNAIDRVRESGTLFVDQHDVKGYVREDGTAVEDYWRDGFERTNPDGNLLNNLKK
ncbi:hypothetical protein PAECIP111893_03823 [Paenibacillus plantiphilus]|uniref:Uncharacterized protein n=1 Tax=Paenibacillus plantiphilus TaxID=2905650 RepID=A0ABM9CKN0_9BACL|nr:hypothetical protein [Paenibacillus plantiphilus]CAH1214613.1 hypothetical protein PAECIP111893_03823 [Paenibacillus plantiphilus]